MMRAIQLAATCAAVLVTTAGYLQAGFIVAAVSVSSDKGSLDSSNAIGHLIDQSGISDSYISGVTDFDAFVGSTTLSVDPGSTNTGWATSTGMTFPANIDFDLGSVQSITRLALWNDKDPQGLGVFEVFSSTDASFSSPVSLGNFSASVQAVGDLAQIFDFTDAITQFIRVRGTPINSPAGLLNIGEFAFDSNGPVSSSPVPEPTSMALFGLGALGLGVRYRRRRREEAVAEAA